MNNALADFFNKRALDYKKKVDSWKQKSFFLSMMRMVSFVLGFAIVVLFASADNVGATWIALIAGSILFFYFIKKHSIAEKQIALFEALQKWNETENKRLYGDLKEIPGGIEFAEGAHPYTGDLDIFGKNSLFALINRCFSPEGSARLANWLKFPSGREEILIRQETVKEIAPLVSFREQFGSYGKAGIKTGKELQSISSWFKTLRETHVPAYQGFIAWISGLAALLILIASLNGLEWEYVFIPVAVNLILLASSRKQIVALMEQSEGKTFLLESLAHNLEQIEKQEFNSKLALQLQSSLKKEYAPASALLKKLAGNFNMLDYSRNPYFYLVGNFLFAWDIHWMASINKWKNRYLDSTAVWIDTGSTMEALTSLAGTSYLWEDSTYPHITESDGLILEGEKFKHPLIFSTERTANSFSIKGKGNAVIITGSNMSGKSTFQRTLGVNMVLAYAGGPVLAENMKVSIMQIFTSMRTADSLQENTSSFYAELKRLKKMMDLFDKKLPVFYLLDEILKGTNSADRHAGCEALMKQLIHMNGMGLIATHDLELTSLEESFPEKVSNFHFSSEVKNGNLYFDYKLKEGVCKSFNALELMRKTGIKV